VPASRSRPDPALELVRLGGGPLEVEIVPAAGARLHRLRAFGHDVLRTPDDPRRHLDDRWFWGGYPMAPWCNRVASGPTAVGGRTVDLAPSFFDGTAIHGLVSAAPWQRTGDEVFGIAGGGDDGSGWPWRFAVEQAFRIDGAVLELVMRLDNRSDEPMPGGIGLHPWFRKPVAVAIAAGEVFPSNIGSVAEPIPVAGPFDRRRLEPMPDDLDATWTAVGDPAVVLAWPDIGLRASLTVAAATPVIVAASPADTDAVAIEPQTHAPDGIRRLVNGEPGALTLVAPGGSLTLTIRLAFEPTVDAGERNGQT
jgi:aldose 1-epimerase